MAKPTKVCFDVMGHILHHASTVIFPTLCLVDTGYKSFKSLLRNSIISCHSQHVIYFVNFATVSLKIRIERPFPLLYD